MRSHILQLLRCICEFEMLHAYLMLWGLKITDLAGCCTRVKQRNYAETLSVPADETHLASQAKVAIDMHRPGASSFVNPSVLPVAPAASGVKVQP